MDHRRRALLFALLALIAGASSAAMVAARPAPAGGPLRDVVVATRDLAAGIPLRPRDLAVRRIPSSFLPTAVLSDPGDALGRRFGVPVPAGAYLLATQFGSAGASPMRDGRRVAGAVEIAVAGTAAIDQLETGDRVDVLVTRDDRTGVGGSTKVLARGLKLLGLRSEGQGESAILAAGSGLARRLVEAEAYARSVRLIGSAPSRVRKR